MRKTKLYQSCHASRPEQVDHRGRRIGITSACAEQTSTSGAPTARRRDHLRVCGADHSPVSRCSSPPGSPPRVRSRPQERGRRRIRLGITSACAEQTMFERSHSHSHRDHLRVCGADDGPREARIAEAGSPPRVRSRRDGREGLPQPLRITSACAEQTQAGLQLPQHRADHLRVCGADHAEPVYTYAPLGSPPRVRSRQLEREFLPRSHGITSACAEQTAAKVGCTELAGDHLRVCGADRPCTWSMTQDAGSPPRVRSRLT